MEEVVTVVCLDAMGSQDSDWTDIQEGASRGLYLYLVYASRGTLDEKIPNENVGDEFITGDNEWNEYELYLSIFERNLTEAGIKFLRLPDKSFHIYSTLY